MQLLISENRIGPSWKFALIFLVFVPIYASAQENLDDDPGDLLDNNLCGAYCLTVSLKALGGNVSLNDVLKELDGEGTRQGYSMLSLERTANKLGFHTYGVKTNFKNLKLRKKPFACIALVDENHYLIFSSFKDGSISVVDPPHMRNVNYESFRNWNGKALLVSDVPITPEWQLNITRPQFWVLPLVVFVTAIFMAYLLARRFNNKTSIARSAGVFVMFLSFVHIGCRDSVSESESFVRGSEKCLEVDSPSIDLGRVLVGANDANAVFNITNNSDSSINIKEIRQSCGCVSVKASDLRVPPKGVITVEVILDTKAVGQKDAEVTLLTSSIEMPLLRMQVSANVYGGISSDTNEIRQLNMETNKVYLHNIALQIDNSIIGKDLELIGGDQNVEFNLLKDHSALTAKLCAKASVDETKTAEVYLESDGRKVYSLLVHYKTKTKGPTVRPKTLELTKKNGQISTKQVVVEMTDQVLTDLDKVVGSNVDIVNWESKFIGKDLVIVSLSIDRSKATNYSQIELHFKTANGQDVTVTIPVLVS